MVAGLCFTMGTCSVAAQRKDWQRRWSSDCRVVFNYGMRLGCRVSTARWQWRWSLVAGSSLTMACDSVAGFQRQDGSGGGDRVTGSSSFSLKPSSVDKFQREDSRWLQGFYGKMAVEREQLALGRRRE
uniref:Uncharacterized protein n=1 Tax=Nelumbo nucifera TaxID=4432 RepID=A0A822XPS0_NELNU|nr:TPA_asm: hypothetical protein HUJ06_022188 [Nelumbo nucifera]